MVQLLAQHSTAQHSRVDYLDTARALCMLWIIGIWHMTAYIKNAQSISNIYTRPITVGVLATFTFISGYFLGGNLQNGKAVITFYQKRLKRFYPLFLLSCFLMWLLPIICGGIRAYISSFEQLIFTITGLACFIKPMPSTIWYFCMILLFYLFTPLITKYKGIKAKVVVSGILYIALLVSYLYGETEERVILYFPVYCLGLLCSGKKIFSEKFQWKAFVVGVLGAVVSTYLIVKIGENPFIQLLPALTYGGVIIEVGKLLTTRKSTVFFSWIAYASMCAYLFHRQYFEVITVTFGRISWLVAECVMFPLLLVGSYGVQKGYDYLMNHFNREKRTA